MRAHIHITESSADRKREDAARCPRRAPAKGKGDELAGFSSLAKEATIVIITVMIIIVIRIVIIVMIIVVIIIVIIVTIVSIAIIIIMSALRVDVRRRKPCRHSPRLRGGGRVMQ